LDAIDILINEHKNIKRVLAAVKKNCEQMAYGKDVDVELYRGVIDFVRNYADKYHHRKEEQRLFNIMGEKDEMIKNGPITGMLLEHDMGRMYIRNLERFLNEYERGERQKKAHIIASALSYVLLLEGHIDKEDNAMYMAARRIIDRDTMDRLEIEYNDIENEESNIEIREKYTAFAQSLRI
jgi:Uncharacterized conserved protein